MALLVEHLQNKHLANFFGGKKPDVAEVEATSQRAALCYHLGQELLQVVPVPLKKLQEVWYENFMSGDGNVDQELEAALLDKSTSFNVAADIQTLKSLVEELNYTRPMAITAEAEQSLALDKWNYVQKQLEYDVTAFEVWKRKCSSVRAASEQAKHEWRLQRRKRCLHAADVFIKASVHLKIWNPKKTEIAIAEVMNMKRNVATKTGCTVEDIHFLVYFNATVPAQRHLQATDFSDFLGTQ